MEPGPLGREILLRPTPVLDSTAGRVVEKETKRRKWAAARSHKNKVGQPTPGGSRRQRSCPAHFKWAEGARSRVVLRLPPRGESGVFVLAPRGQSLRMRCVRGRIGSLPGSTDWQLRPPSVRGVMGSAGASPHHLTNTFHVRSASINHFPRRTGPMGGPLVGVWACSLSASVRRSG